MKPIIIKPDTKNTPAFILLNFFSVILFLAILKSLLDPSNYSDPMPFLLAGGVFFLACISALLQKQTLILSSNGVESTMLTFLRLQKKRLALESLECWYYHHHYSGRFSAKTTFLVIKSNKGPKPKLPYSFSTKLDHVIIVPPLFEHQFPEIEAFLTLQGLSFCGDD